ncbi:MAG: adenosylcobinamide-GDP ribazoletransferase [Roseobacter sp.]|jgi:adenosylcobinamide-GDP ribazoletransferase|nr:adenosylcobinamide-GDP ribazoletransferase [Roseobacter sp.]
MKSFPALSFLTDVPLAFVLLTRWPMPRLPEAAFAQSARAVWAYSLVGGVLGLVACLCAALATTVGLPVSIAAGLTLAALMLSTGAMHEDGLADTLDGFWGGQDLRRRLEIMQDSQIGSFGTLGLIVVVLLRWAALAALLPIAPLAIIAAASLSRAAMPIVMHVMPHARKDGLSRRVGRPSLGAVVAGVTLAVVVSFLTAGSAGLAALAAVLTVTAGIMAIARAKIKGQTGDVLGATQQVSELAALLCLVVVMT